MGPLKIQDWLHFGFSGGCQTYCVLVFDEFCWASGNCEKTCFLIALIDPGLSVRYPGPSVKDPGLSVRP